MADLIDRDALINRLQIKADTDVSFGCSASEFTEALNSFVTLTNNTPTYTTYATSPARATDKLFRCPCCGTHYLARDPGFVPNCHNCGAVMRCEDLC